MKKDVLKLMGTGPEPSFEAAIHRLEEIVERIEGEELELAESLALFEEGVQLLRRAEELLSGVEVRAQQLFAHGEGFRMAEFGEDG